MPPSFIGGWMKGLREKSVNDASIFPAVFYQALANWYLCTSCSWKQISGKGTVVKWCEARWSGCHFCTLCCGILSVPQWLSTNIKLVRSFFCCCRIRKFWKKLICECHADWYYACNKIDYFNYILGWCRLLNKNVNIFLATRAETCTNKC